MNNVMFEDFPKICRLCLSCGDLQPIINIKDIKVLAAVTSINIKEDDKLPENVCDSCVRQLEDLSSFITTCENNYHILRKIVIENFGNNFSKQVASYDSDNEIFGEPIELKNEDDYSNDSYCRYSIKQEFIIEPDFEEENESNNLEGPVSCENCSELFPNQESLSDHYKVIEMCRPIDYHIETSDVPNIINYLKKTKKERKPRNKKEKKFDEEEPEFVKGRQLKGKRRFLCCYCGKNYTRKNGLDRHMLSHSGIKPFECKECGKRYFTKDTLKTHLLTHSGVKSHKCSICQKMFTQSSHLSYHMRRHTGDKPYLCAFCGKGFLSNYHLERHKLMHTGMKPFQCNQCGKRFVRGTTLRDHLLIHTGEKPFQCQHCGKQFNRKQSLTNHMLVHSGQVKQSRSARITRINSSDFTDSRSVELNKELLTIRSDDTDLIGHNSNEINLVAHNNSVGVGYITVASNLMYSDANPTDDF